MPLAEAQIEDLQKQAVEAAKKADAISKEFEGKDMPADKAKQFEAYMDEHDAKAATAARERRNAETQKAIEAPVHDHPILNGSEGKAADSGEREDRSVAEIFHTKAMRKYLGRGMNALTPEERKAVSSLSDNDGGALASPEFSRMLLAKLRDIVKLRGLATVITTDKQSISFPTLDYDDEPDQTAENETITRVDPTDWTGKRLFVPTKTARTFGVPEELIEDADFDILGLLTDHFAVLFAEKEEKLFLRGTGQGEALGLETAALTANDIAGSTTVIAVEDIIDAVYDIREAYRGTGCAYLMHRNVMREVRKLRGDGGGGAGTGDLLWQPSLQAGQPPTLNGFPALESEFMTDPVSGVGAADGDPMFIFGNFRFYWIIDRKTLQIKRLEEKYAEKDQIGLRLKTRLDGAPVDPNAFIRYNRK